MTLLGIGAHRTVTAVSPRVHLTTPEDGASTREPGHPDRRTPPRPARAIGHNRPMPPAVRPADPTDATDLDTLCRLRVAFIADHHGRRVEDLDADFTRQTRDFLTEQQQAGSIHSWLALDGATAVGAVSLLVFRMPPRPGDPRTAEGYVINMFVAPSHRRRGIGRELFAACCASADRLQLRRLLLHATPDGRPLYTAFGFAPNDAWLELPIPRIGDG